MLWKNAERSITGNLQVSVQVSQVVSEQIKQTNNSLYIWAQKYGQDSVVYHISQLHSNTSEKAAHQSEGRVNLQYT